MLDYQDATPANVELAIDRFMYVHLQRFKTI
jgi:hypothetical protein